MIGTDRSIPHGFDTIDAVIDAVCAHAGARVKRERGDECVLDPCPFGGCKGDRFAVNAATGAWNCPKCGEKGNAWNLVERLGLGPVARVRPASRPSGPARPRLLQDAIDHAYRNHVEDLERNEDVQRFLAQRGILLPTARAWGLCSDGERLGFPYRRPNGRIAFVKWRPLRPKADGPKTYRWPSNEERPLPSDSPLFAHRDFDATKPVTITEGEFDAVTLWQSGHRNVVSVANGARAWEPAWSATLAPAPQLFLAFDRDADGEAGADAVVHKFGRERCLRLTFGEHKDANDAARAGWAAAEFERAYLDARRYRPAILKSAREIAFDLAQRAEEGRRPEAILTGHASFDATQRGLRPGEMTVVTAHTGHGKTAYTLDLALRLTERGVAVFYFSMEQGSEATVEQLVGMVRHQDCEDLKAEEIRAAAEAIPEEFLIGTEPETNRVEQAVEAIRFAVIVYGVRVVVVDHLDNLIDPQRDETRYTAASRAVREIHRAAVQHGVHVLLIAQPTTDSGRARGRDRDADTPPPPLVLADIAETRLVRQLAHNGWVISSDKNNHALTVHVQKARYGPAREGERLHYRFDGFRFQEIPRW